MKIINHHSDYTIGKMNDPLTLALAQGKIDLYETQGYQNILDGKRIRELLVIGYFKNPS